MNWPNGENRSGRPRERRDRAGAGTSSIASLAERRARELDGPDRETEHERPAGPARHWCGAGARIASTSRRPLPVLLTPCATPSGATSRSPACHRQLAAFEQEQAFAFDHLVDLVLPGMRVQRVFLARLERVEADQQPRRFEDRALAHLRGRVGGVIGGDE